MLQGNLHELVIIDLTCRVVDAVLNRVVDLAREVYPRTVRQVSTVCKAHSHNGVAGLKKCVEDRNVRARSGVWLNVGIRCTKQFLGTLNRQNLCTVNELATTVVTLTRITLRVLVRKDAPLRLKNARTCIIL